MDFETKDLFQHLRELVIGRSFEKIIGIDVDFADRLNSIFTSGMRISFKSWFDIILEIFIWSKTTAIN